eukprot:TRINITY_DN5698_c1_g1_i2.p1 TRINITY_DN5698_c1_g1~~TRINITY_DN5698_c1_g1_i2.p1  ORF type:complete len:246 (+),score=48.32 TRINITY_DN5698_c1_g1_i2:54-791(+)
MKMEAELLYLSLVEPDVAMSPEALEVDLLPMDFTDDESGLTLLVLLGRFSLISALFSMGSDVCAQSLEGKPLREHNWSRTGKYMVTGTVFVGLTQFARLSFIDKIFQGSSHTITVALEKTILNQFVLAPIVNAGAMAAIEFSQTYSTATVMARLRANYCEAQIVGYAVKPLGNLTAFLLFPSNLVAQLVITRTVAFGYNTYFSIVTHRPLPETEEDEPCSQNQFEDTSKRKPVHEDGSVLCCSVM